MPRDLSALPIELHAAAVIAAGSILSKPSAEVVVRKDGRTRGEGQPVEAQCALLAKAILEEYMKE